ncbi:MAG: hypothetical protein WC807_18640 [Hyphomicrobium sp.]|jgi:hypothetical protein
MLDAFSPEASLFNADTELRRILLGSERKPIPFISILNFGLPLLVDAKSTVASERSPQTSEISR